MSRKKQKRRDRKKKDRRGERPLPPKLLDALEEVEALIRRKRWDEARAFLEMLDHRYPRRKEVLLNLARVYEQQNDLTAFRRAADRLVALAPDQPEYLIVRAGANLATGSLFMALRDFYQFLDRWPNHAEAARARKTMAAIEAEADRIIAEQGLPPEEARRVLVLQDELTSLLEAGQFAEARRTAEQVVHLRPGFVPALNNLGEVYFRTGHPDQAISTAQQVLASDPDNPHALANLARYLYLGGRAAEAQPWVDKLKALTGNARDLWVKKAEILAHLGDDQGVLEALRGAEQAGAPRDDPHYALLLHLAGVAAYRQGDEKAARDLWKRTLKTDPGMFLARANLEDLRRPIGEREAAWPFAVSTWVPGPAIDSLRSLLRPAGRHASDEAITRQVRLFLDRHPELVPLVPPLLDRGDPPGRGFALRLALLADTPELNAALRDFAVGQRGPDDLRMEAAQAALRAGLLPSGQVRMWVRGEWTDVILLGFEVSGEPVQAHSPRAEPLVRRALDALHDGDAETGERLVNEALALEPDSPTLLNNLAAAYAQQGRQADSERIIRDLHRRFPDYLFARTNLAALHAHRREFEQARALLEPVLLRRKLHFSEFAALAGAEIELAWAEGNRESARSWLEMWERIDPDHPNLALLKEKVKRGGLSSRLFGR